MGELARTTEKLAATLFVDKGREAEPGDWDPQDRAQLQLVRTALPELAEWGDLALGLAWGSYSEDVWLLSWLEMDQHALDRKSLIPFLAYIHYHAEIGAPKWGLTKEELRSFALELGVA